MKTFTAFILLFLLACAARAQTRIGITDWIVATNGVYHCSCCVRTNAFPPLPDDIGTALDITNITNAVALLQPSTNGYIRKIIVTWNFNPLLTSNPVLVTNYISWRITVSNSCTGMLETNWILDTARIGYVPNQQEVYLQMQTLPGITGYTVWWSSNLTDWTVDSSNVMDAHFTYQHGEPQMFYKAMPTGTNVFTL